MDGIRFITASIHDRNIIAVIRMFSGSGNMTALVRLLFDVSVRGQTKMAVCSRKWILNTVYLSSY